MKKEFVLFYLLFVFVACSDKIYDETNLENDIETGVLKSYSGDGKYDALGHGYDLSGSYFTPKDVKGIVIDNDRIEKVNKKYIDISQGAWASPDFITGYTAQDYTNTLSSSIKIDWKIEGVAPKLFAGSIKQSYNSTYKYYSKYSFTEYNHPIIHRAYTYMISDKDLIKYVSDEFKNAVQKESPEFVIQKYGTAVLTNVIIGARLRLLYRCQVRDISIDIKDTIEANASAGIAKVFSINTSSSSHTISKNNIYDEYLSYELIGGEPNMPIVGEIPLGGTSVPKIDLNKWLSTCTDAPKRSQLINVQPESIIPIWNFVEDGPKKEALKAAVVKYLLGKEFKDVYSGVPLKKYKVEYSNVVFYDLTTANTSEYDGKKGYKCTYLGVDGCVSLRSIPGTGMIPIYRYEKTNGGNFKSAIFSIDWNEYGYGDSRISYKGIVGYVFDRQLIELKANNSGDSSSSGRPSSGGSSSERPSSGGSSSGRPSSGGSSSGRPSGTSSRPTSNNATSSYSASDFVKLYNLVGIYMFKQVKPGDVSGNYYTLKLSDNFYRKELYQVTSSRPTSFQPDSNIYFYLLAANAPQ